ncbi:MAG: hypothetical protein ACLQU4_04325 [Limisphaerales bacterium]
MEMAVNQATWERAAQGANNLSELELTLGDIPVAVRDAEQSVTYADRGGDAFIRMGVRTTHANALYQAGRWAEAEARFREAEKMQIKRQPEYPLLYSVWGFHYCDFLLAAPERAAWQVICHAGLRPPEAAVAHRAALQGVSQRSAKMFEWRIPGDPLLDIALDHLTEGRAAFYEAILEDSSLKPCHGSLQHAVDGLRRAGTMHYIPRSLLTRSWIRFLSGASTGHESAQSDLDEAWEIAERGPMKLYMADIHLYRARLFFREAKYPWESPPTDLAAAEKLINDCGYHRRDEELADAKRAILGK